jgi:hypothetical protein
MKKVVLMLAFAGLVGSVSASVNHDDKDKGKKECKKGEKSCCKEKSGAEGKSCSGDKKEGKSCCKDKKAAEAKPAETK